MRRPHSRIDGSTVTSTSRSTKRRFARPVPLRIERSIQALLALQTPVARDLRLLLAILHINLLLERCGDGCVTVAKLSRLVADVDPIPR